MGLLIDGIWHDRWYDTEKTGGRFERSESRYRNWITADGSPGPTGEGGFQAEPKRYHLYVSYACPWAHRTLIFRELKGLTDMVSLSVTHWLMAERGWTFDDAPGVVPDPIHGARALYEIYVADDPKASGRATTPLLWDKKQRRIVSNESADIIRMFNSAFDHVGAKPGDFYPAHLRTEIDALNQRIYDNVNNGVYKAGFATRQSAYEEAASRVFDMLDELEERLGGSRYLFGSEIMETDWRLFTSLIRFDAVYFGHFKCNRRRLVDYPNLFAYTSDLFQVPGIEQTVHFDHIKNHYYQSHKNINPTGVVPIGPDVDFGRRVTK
jgi:glutathionyl-hydroquinone reductase